MKLVKVIFIITLIFSFVNCNKKKAEVKVQDEKLVPNKKFSLTENERKSLFKEIAQAEDKVNAYLKSKQDSLLNLKLDKINLKKQYDLLDDLYSL